VSRFAQLRAGTNRIAVHHRQRSGQASVTESSYSRLQTGELKMTFTEYTQENAPINARPDCPQCASQMYLARIELEKPGHDLRTFECPRCQHIETAVVKFT
jgi:hypothetical protein